MRRPGVSGTPFAELPAPMAGEARRSLRRIDLRTSVEHGPKRRRVDRLVEVATAALERGHRAQALAAVADIAAWDPNNPQLAILKTRLVDFTRPNSPHSSRLVGVAAMVGCVVLGGYFTYHAFEKQASPQTPSGAAAALATQLTLPVSGVPSLSVASTPFRLQESIKTGRGRVVVERNAKGTTGSRHAEESRRSNSAAASRGKPARSATKMQPTTDSVATASVVQENLSATAAERVVAASPPPSESAHVSFARSTDVATLTTSAINAMPAIPTTSTTNDERLVRMVLQRYREAYSELDARAARAVWPRVDETALARAFDGLRSQRITFNDCNLEVEGDAASARCRGSMRYVPKIGSQAPRVEPRVWNFSLRKQGTDWAIESARAER